MHPLRQRVLAQSEQPLRHSTTCAYKGPLGAVPFHRRVAWDSSLRQLRHTAPLSGMAKSAISSDGHQWRRDPTSRNTQGER